MFWWFWRRGWGRGFGWGARLGYCPWTGLPRGWRFRWPYYGGYVVGAPSTAITSGFAFTKDWELQALKNYAKNLEAELEAIKKRIDELEKS